MPKKDSSYRQAVERLRERHSDKIEDIFMEMYKIVRFTGGETKDGETRLPSENKDRVNAAKVCVSLLGVPKPAVEKEKPHKKDAKEIKAEAKPTAEEMSVIEARLVQ